jgi:hypothetical protein
MAANQFEMKITEQDREIMELKNRIIILEKEKEIKKLRDHLATLEKENSIQNITTKPLNIIKIQVVACEVNISVYQSVLKKLGRVGSTFRIIFKECTIDTIEDAPLILCLLDVTLSSNSLRTFQIMRKRILGDIGIITLVDVQSQMYPNQLLCNETSMVDCDKNDSEIDKLIMRIILKYGSN